jgi:hypothetical protein
MSAVMPRQVRQRFVARNCSAESASRSARALPTTRWLGSSWPRCDDGSISPAATCLAAHIARIDLGATFEFLPSVMPRWTRGAGDPAPVRPADSSSRQAKMLAPDLSDSRATLTWRSPCQRKLVSSAIQRLGLTRPVGIQARLAPGEIAVNGCLERSGYEVRVVAPCTGGHRPVQR